MQRRGAALALVALIAALSSMVVWRTSGSHAERPTGGRAISTTDLHGGPPAAVSAFAVYADDVTVHDIAVDAALVEQRRAEEEAQRQAEQQRLADEQRRAAEYQAWLAAQPRPAPRASAVVTGDVWWDLAVCECGGNPGCNTGNGFYGTFQFLLSTWRAVGGSGYPHEHDYETQKFFAQVLQARSGWGQWPACARKLGLL